MKSRLEIWLAVLCFFSTFSLAQSAHDKDADKKMPATPPVEAARKEPKPEKKKDEKKAEPKDKDEENKEEKKGGMTADTFSGLKVRLLGPAVASGRVTSVAVNPKNKFEYYVARKNPIRLDGSRSIRMMRRWCGWAAARVTASAAWDMAMEFTGPMMAARIGRT